MDMEVVSGGDEGDDHNSDMDSGMAGQVRLAKPHKKFASCAVRSVYGHICLPISTAANLQRCLKRGGCLLMSGWPMCSAGKAQRECQGQYGTCQLWMTMSRACLTPLAEDCAGIRVILPRGVACCGMAR